MSAKLGEVPATELPVTVVSGLPRSGTSLMLQMLAAGGMPVLTDHARPPDADNPRGYFEFDPVKRSATDARWAADAVGKAVKVIHLLLPNLPPAYHYRVLFMHRDMDEVLASQRAMLDGGKRRGADLPAGRLAEIFEGQLRRVREWVGRQPNFAALDVEHRRVIADPLREAQTINDFLGGTLDASRMAAVVDASLYRQRKGDRNTAQRPTDPPTAGRD